MSSWTALLAAYLLGGLTFVPLVLGLVFLHAYLTLPVVHADAEAQEKERSRGGGKRDVSNKEKSHDRSSSSSLDDADADIFDALPPELKSQTARTHVPDVAAGYFAVCREYVPGGINGKPPERTTPAGAVVAAESPSVYQAMYRSIFERGKNMSPTLEVGNGSAGGGKKRGRNVFFVVLRLGILMLYDDSEQLEVRHVISLAHYDVDIYSGGDKIPEGELWIKRNCIRLTHRKQPDSPQSDAKPYFLFSDNCSDKEDFYHAMLQSQDHRSDTPRNPPRPLKFETTDLVRLVQQLHASEENLHTRWINALIGRLFLAMYKTDQVEQFIWNKITKKISRVPKPALISKIDLQKVDMGSLPPFITNPKLRELTVDGDLMVEADVSYKGNFRVEISAVARIELGSRFKNRDFTTTLGLAATLKKLEGHILLRVKPPPSNRLWMTFESAPRMELALEPIWGSRQITYGPILRAMESRLREVVGETLVLPNWDDFPFKDTEMSEFRGGIWGSDGKKGRGTGKQKDGAATTAEAEAGEGVAEHERPLAEKEYESDEEAEGQVPGLPPRSGLERKLTSSTATVSTLELTAEVHTPLPSPAASVRPSTKPKAMRSSSFASAASPIVNVDAASASATKIELKDGHQDAAAAMKTISLSQPGSPTDTPVGSPPQSNHMQSALERGASSSSLKLQQVQLDHDTASSHSAGPYSSSHSVGSQTSISQAHEEKSTKHTTKKGTHASSASLPRNTFASTAERGKIINQSINSAASAAKKWWNNKQQGSSGASSPSLSNITNGHKHGPASPFSRGQPGTPLSTSAPDEALHGHERGRSSDAHGTTTSLSSETASITSTTTTTTTLTNTIADTTAPLGSPANPIGRGQLIPESGPMSPKTEKKGWAGVVPSAATLVGMTKRKPVVQRKAVGGQAQAQVHGQGQGIRGGAGEGDGHERDVDRDKESKEKEKDKKEIEHHHATSTGVAPPSSSRTSTSSTTAPTANFSAQQHHTQHHGHGHERKTSVGTAAMGMGTRKKSSSIQSLPPSGLSAGHGHGHGHGHGRRQRRAVTESAGSGSGFGFGLGIGSGQGDKDGDGDGVFVIEAPREVDVEVEGDGEEERDRALGRRDAERQGSGGSGGSAGSGLVGIRVGGGEDVEGAVFRGMEDVVGE